jgi:hypothetical protein
MLLPSSFFFTASHELEFDQISDSVHYLLYLYPIIDIEHILFCLPLLLFLVSLSAFRNSKSFDILTCSMCM